MQATKHDLIIPQNYQDILLNYVAIVSLQYGHPDIKEDFNAEKKRG